MKPLKRQTIVRKAVSLGSGPRWAKTNGNVVANSVAVSFVLRTVQVERMRKLKDELQGFMLCVCLHARGEY